MLVTKPPAQVKQSLWFVLTWRNQVYKTNLIELFEEVNLMYIANGWNETLTVVQGCQKYFAEIPVTSRHCV